MDEVILAFIILERQVQTSRRKEVASSMNWGPSGLPGAL